VTVSEITSPIRLSSGVNSHKEQPTASKQIRSLASTINSSWFVTIL